MTIRYGVKAGVARLQIDRPERRNALDAAMRVELADQVERAAADPEVRAVVLAGVPGHFCSGADLGQFAGETLASSRLRMRRGGLKIIDGLTRMEKPVIASVDGPAVGLGWALALACDHVVVSTRARFALTYAKVGLVPDCGAAHMLVRNIGMLRAKELIFSGRFVDASEALAMGLATEIVDEDKVESHVEAVAQRFAAGPTFAYGMSKHMLHQALSPSLGDFFDIEALVAPQMRFTEDYREGTTAFREKRPPNFKGN